MNMQNTQPAPQNNTTDQLAQARQSSGQWMTLQEASESTGFALGTLRRYIKRGSLRFRRLGRSLNSKLEVFVTPNMLQSDAGDRVSTAGIDDVLTQEVEAFDPLDDQDDYTPDQSTSETMTWLRTRVDEKDAKIEALMKELQGATYRNGYLESQLETTKDQIKLLTDGNRSKKSWWAKFSSWFIGTK
jgi:hypothetical protein